MAEKGERNFGNKFLFWSTVSWDSLLKVKSFTSAILKGVVPVIPSSHFSKCQFQKYLAFKKTFIIYNPLSNQVLLCFISASPNFTAVSFLAKLKIF